MVASIEEFRAKSGDPTPLYLQFASSLRQLINVGALAEGVALPPERRIMEQTSVSRVTIRKAFQLLANEGLLEQKRGSGTFVASGLPKIEHPINRLSSFTEDMLSRGVTAKTRWLEKSLAYPTPEEVMLFGLSPGEKVLRLHRLRFGDAVPLAVEYATVPARFLPNPEKISGSLYMALTGAKAMPVKATQRIQARSLPATEADLLDASTGEPTLYVEQASRLKDGTLVEFTRSYYRGDTYDFVAELSLKAAPA